MSANGQVGCFSWPGLNQNDPPFGQGNPDSSGPGDWAIRGQDYSGNEDKILKRAYLAGFPHAKYKLRGQQYEVDFRRVFRVSQRT